MKLNDQGGHSDPLRINVKSMGWIISIHSLGLLVCRTSHLRLRDWWRVIFWLIVHTATLYYFKNKSEFANIRFEQKVIQMLRMFRFKCYRSVFWGFFEPPTYYPPLCPYVIVKWFLKQSRFWYVQVFIMSFWKLRNSRYVFIPPCDEIL